MRTVASLKNASALWNFYCSSINVLYKAFSGYVVTIRVVHWRGGNVRVRFEYKQHSIMKENVNIMGTMDHILITVLETCIYLLYYSNSQNTLNISFYSFGIVFTFVNIGQMVKWLLS